MTTDPQGYARLKRGIDFLAIEAREAQVSASSALEDAASFYGYGSPSEFMGESLLAIEATLADASHLAPSVRRFAEELAEEIRRGFEEVGGG